MATLTVSLPDEMKAYIEAQVAEEGYASASEYLQALLRDARMSQARKKLEAKLDEALASGPAEPMTREDWESIEREAIERSSRDEFKSA
jgi:antitoxin ParD1/3/4